MSRTVGPHNFYNLDDFCSTDDVDGNTGSRAAHTLAEWEASVAVRPDGSLPRMDELLHQDAMAESARAARCAEERSASTTATLNGGGNSGLVNHVLHSNCGKDADPSEHVLGAVEQWCGVDRSMMSWLGNAEVIFSFYRMTEYFIKI